jgi:hypothetical protein
MTEIIENYIGSETTVISFSGVGRKKLPETKPEFNRLSELGYNVIHVMDNDRSWFNAIEEQRIIALIKTDTVHCIGNSMEAFNAVTFSNLHPVKSVLAFATQYSIHPELVPWETRWKGYANTISKQHGWKYPSLEFNKTTNYLFISGGTSGRKNQDAAHLAAIPDSSNITKITRDGYHNIARTLRKQGTLYSTIEEFFNQ